MSFLSGLANFAQDAGPTAGAVAQAQAQGSAQRNQQALQMLMLARQQRQAEVENALKQDQGTEARAHAGLYTNEANPQFAGLKAGAVKQAEEPFDIAKAQRDLSNHLVELQQSGANELQVTAARIAGEKSISDAQIAASASRQTNQQGFTATQNDLNRKATATNQGNAQQAHAANITQTQSGQVLPIIESLVNRGPLAHHPKVSDTSAPSSTGTSTANPQQSDWDNAAQHLQVTKPGVDPSSILGPRP